MADGTGPDTSIGLTARELEILPLLADGRTNREIAEAVFLSDKTVKNYVSSILRKMDLERRAQIFGYLASHHPLHVEGVGSKPTQG